MNILIVEDNQITQLILQKYLNNWGYSSFMADSGEKGLQEFQARRSELQKAFKLVLLDLHLPGENGYETFKKIRDLDFQVPILAMTASIHFDKGMHPVEYGMNDIVFKPFEPERLKGLLAQYILK